MQVHCIGIMIVIIIIILRKGRSVYMSRCLVQLIPGSTDDGSYSVGLIAIQLTGFFFFFFPMIAFTGQQDIKQCSVTLRIWDTTVYTFLLLEDPCCDFGPGQFVLSQLLLCTSVELTWDRYSSINSFQQLASCGT